MTTKLVRIGVGKLLLAGLTAPALVATVLAVTAIVSGPRSAAAQDQKQSADKKPADEKKADEKKADEKKADEKKADEPPRSNRKFVITRHGAELKLAAKTLNRLDMGTVFLVQQQTDDWYGGAVLLSGKWHTGWVRRIDLVDEANAFKHFSQQLQRTPNNFMVRMVRGRLLRNQGKYREALADYNVAVRLRPREANAYSHRGFVHFLQDNYQAAVRDYTQAIRLNPKDAVALTNRGNNYEEMGKFKEALADYDAAIKASDRNALALNNRAWLLATCPVDKIRNGQSAVTSAAKAVQLTKSQNFDYLDTLAAAHAELQQFEEAVRIIDQAIKIAPDDDKPALEGRKKLYQKKQPYRQR